MAPPVPRSALAPIITQAARARRCRIRACIRWRLTAGRLARARLAPACASAGTRVRRVRRRLTRVSTLLSSTAGRTARAPVLGAWGLAPASLGTLACCAMWHRRLVRMSTVAQMATAVVVECASVPTGTRVPRAPLHRIRARTRHRRTAAFTGRALKRRARARAPMGIAARCVSMRRTPAFIPSLCRVGAMARALAACVRVRPVTWV